MTDQVLDENDKTAEAARNLAKSLTELAIDAAERKDAKEAKRLIDNAIWYKKYAERLENGE